MKTITRTRRLIVASVAAMALSAGLMATPASALNRVTCGSRTDWLRIFNYNYTGLLCFANPGSQSVRIYQVNEIDAGNNNVYFETADGYYDSLGHGGWEAFSWNPEVTYLQTW